MKNKEKFIEYFLMRYKWKQILETIEKQHDMNSTDRKLLVFLHYSGVIPAAKIHYAFYFL